MITNAFLKDFLAGNKQMLKKKDTRDQKHIPKYPELHVPSLWNEVKNLKNIAIYFPDSFIYQKRIPNREYLFNVLLLDSC